MSPATLRVLIVDDSATSRALLRALCEAEEGLTVVGEAEDGYQAVAQVAALRPSLVVMDIHMPHLDGIAAARMIMSRTPTPILIVTAAADVHDVELALQASRAGALRVISKPAGPSSPRFVEESRRFLLLVKALAGVHPIRLRAERRPEPESSATAPPMGGAGLRGVGVASSTGGPTALRRFLAALPETLDAPLLLVQHTAPQSTSRLADWLAEATKRPVKLAEQGEALVPGTVYLAPEGRHLMVTDPGRVWLSQHAPVGGYRPSASALFHSMAKVFGDRTAAVVLTGMGSDGLEGARALREAGAAVLAQDQASSAVFGMPKAIIEAGLAVCTGPAEYLASCLGSMPLRRS